MGLGKQNDRQSKMWISFDEMPRSGGHAFYDRLQAILHKHGFDRFVEDLCALTTQRLGAAGRSLLAAISACCWSATSKPSTLSAAL